MIDGDRGDVTWILRNIDQRPGDFRVQTDRLFEMVNDELRRVAVRLMRGERRGHTLQPTALINEAYLRLVRGPEVSWQGRAHFLQIAASAMRRILVEHARRRHSLKRGGGIRQVTLDENLDGQNGSHLDILALDDALTRLSDQDWRMGKVVELRVFGGMSIVEIAHVLSISRRTAFDDWGVAKQWLSRELARG